mmetsp:Transcript_29727/g.88920  ORF Transcript_29727/g.88920 Transcript_29727/m.88920 type:complete len:143 (-) Transcript_29727:55-483(-)
MSLMLRENQPFTTQLAVITTMFCEFLFQRVPTFFAKMPKAQRRWTLLSPTGPSPPSLLFSWQSPCCIQRRYQLLVQADKFQSTPPPGIRLSCFAVGFATSTKGAELNSQIATPWAEIWSSSVYHVQLKGLPRGAHKSPLTRS